MQIAQIQLRMHYCTPCSDAISGPKNRVCEIKSGHDFCRYRNSIQVIYFQINGCIHIPSRASTCKRKFWLVQGKGQGNQIYQEMARKFEPGQGNCEEILKIVYIRNKIELKVEIYLQ